MLNRQLVSVVIPTYNREHIISRAIESVLKQTYENWELIISDDCSIDDTEKVVKSYSDKRIKFVKLSKNLGNAGARNFGVKNASGEYIAFLDSDDEFMPNCLQEFLDTVNNSAANSFNFAFSGYYILDDNTKKLTEKLWKPKPNITFLEELKIGTGCGLFINKKCFDEIGYFDERLRVAVDTDWLIRLNNAFSYIIVPKYLVILHKHSGARVRNNKRELLKSYEIIFEKNQKQILANKSIIRKFYYKLQWLNYHQNKRSEGNKYFLKLLNNRIIFLQSIAALVLYNFLPIRLAKTIHLKISGSSI